MPIDITWEDGGAEINILCDGCDKEFSILTEDITGLQLCHFCGHYLEVDDVHQNEENDEEEDSWD